MKISNLNKRVKHTYEGPIWMIEAIEELIFEVNETYRSMGVTSAIVYAYDQWSEEESIEIKLWGVNEDVLCELDYRLQDAI